MSDGGPTRQSAAGIGLRQCAEGLRPAQAGVVLVGAARPEHVVATVVDLSFRRRLRIQRIGRGPHAEWLVTRRHSIRGRSGGLALYEWELLHALFARRWLVYLPDFTGRFAQQIDHVYTRLTRQAFSNGWLAPEADAMADDPEFRRLRARLSRLRADLAALHPPDVDRVSFHRAYLPYAIALGHPPSWARHFDGMIGAFAEIQRRERLTERGQRAGYRPPRTDRLWDPAIAAALRGHYPR